MSLRVGVLGTSRIAVDMVVPALREADPAEVAAIASRDGPRARAVADRLGVPAAFEGYGALVASDAVDAIYVPLPNHLHAEWSIAAARSGKHVLCEKPLALDVTQAEAMASAAEDAGVVLAEAFMYRHHPQWRRVRALVGSGALGELVTVQTSFSSYKDDPHDIRNVAAYGGGALMDIGCYGIDVARWLFADEPLRAVGSLHLDPRLQVDTLASGVLDFSGGRHGTFTCGMRSASDQRVHVVGAAGRLTVEAPFNTPPDHAARLTVSTDTATEVVDVPPANHYTLQADAFAAAVLDGAPVPVPAANGAANLRVIEALRAQAR